ncbi:MAG: hypothetical protein JW929_08995 [Anaerolineales bacterium]|nr:hypothetical protein [Anaerolineales bacterium]
MPKVEIILSELEHSALERLSRSEGRTTKKQAAAVIRERLKRRGLLPKSNPTPQPSMTQPMSNQA